MSDFSPSDRDQAGSIGTDPAPGSQEPVGRSPGTRQDVAFLKWIHPLLSQDGLDFLSSWLRR